MANRADVLMEQGGRKRGRSRLRWEDCVRRGIYKVGVVEEWRELSEDRGRWRSIVVKAGQKLCAIGPHPFERKQEENNNIYNLDSITPTI